MDSRIEERRQAFKQRHLDREGSGVRHDTVAKVRKSVRDAALVLSRSRGEGAATEQVPGGPVELEAVRRAVEQATRVLVLHEQTGGPPYGDIHHNCGNGGSEAAAGTSVLPPPASVCWAADVLLEVYSLEEESLAAALPPADAPSSMLLWRAVANALCMSQGEGERLKLAWLLTNAACSSHLLSVVLTTSAGAVEALCGAVEATASLEVAAQAIWALANLLGDGSEVRDEALRRGGGILLSTIHRAATGDRLLRCCRSSASRASSSS
eukprot:GHVU01081745.1.p1 GENE.GHVU01081745.1~~GHVU01081745.1.p1  ORF type:complete len:267 (-),score=43.38 GHVU01081745.1:397-1197(-)